MLCVRFMYARKDLFETGIYIPNASFFIIYNYSKKKYEPGNDARASFTCYDTPRTVSASQKFSASQTKHKRKNIRLSK